MDEVARGLPDGSTGPSEAPPPLPRCLACQRGYHGFHDKLEFIQFKNSEPSHLTGKVALRHRACVRDWCTCRRCRAEKVVTRK